MTMSFKFKTEPFPHQQECFDRFKDHPTNYLALLADMGVGKSKIAIDIAAYKWLKGSHDRVIVIAPSSVHNQWLDEQFPEHCAVEWHGKSYSPKKTQTELRVMDTFIRRCAGSKKLLILTINYESFIKRKGIGLELCKRFISTSKKPPFIIVDEASRIKNPDAKTTKNINLLRDWYSDGYRVIVTGTPAAKSPVDMWSLFDFLKKRYMGCSYTAFQYEHAVMIDKKFKVKERLITRRTNLDEWTFHKIRKDVSNEISLMGNDTLSWEFLNELQRKYGVSEDDVWFIVSSDEFTRFKNLDKLQKKIAPVTYSIAKADALDLPDKVYKQVSFELSNDQKKAIKELKEYSATVYEGETLSLEMKATLGTRVLQICGGFFSHNTPKEGEYATIPLKGANKKLQYIKNDIPEIGNGQFIVWSVFIPELKMLYDELSKNFSVGLFSKAHGKAASHEVLSQFKNGEIQGMISNPLVGGYGLNLQCATVQYWYSRNYRTEARLQAEDRSHRIGISRSPVYKDLLYNSSFEHKVLASLMEGKEINSYFMSSEINELFKTFN